MNNWCYLLCSSGINLHLSSNHKHPLCTQVKESRISMIMGGFVKGCQMKVAYISRCIAFHCAWGSGMVKDYVINNIIQQWEFTGYKRWSSARTIYFSIKLPLNNNYILHVYPWDWICYEIIIPISKLYMYAL